MESVGDKGVSFSTLGIEVTFVIEFDGGFDAASLWRD